MKKEVDIILYDNKHGIRIDWELGFCITVDIDKNEVLIKANSEGLISLAKHLLTIAESEVPKGTHIHLDEYNSLEDGSAELIIEKE